MTNAEMDLPQFIEIFGMRAAGARITIPRAVERWFEDPQSPQELLLNAAIQRHRAASVARLEQELFAQKKRLADAERKLAVKETKAAAESRRIATTKAEKLLSKLKELQEDAPRATDGRIFPMNYAPLVVGEGGRKLLRLARYHCRLQGQPAGIDQQFPGLYNARRDNIDRYWRPAFGTSHALLLVTSFYENVQREGRNVVLHFVPKPAQVMRVACLYSQWRDPVSGETLLSFAAITDEPPPEVAAAGHDRMIVNLKPEHAERWLDPAGASLEELHAILGDRQAPYYEHQVMAA
jgi:putative SOS response-associated peptidase YedK